ncbi:MAG TPA: molybdopterin molybdotransferase MoeA [Opitutales bacterium]|nr:molybdopterin molybdotransferase MoeA [Opitutales bacterium]
MPKLAPPPECSVAEVWKLLDARIKPLPHERVLLSQALGRILRENIHADADQPPFDRSAVDGYALIPGPLSARYRVIGSVKAGEVAQRAPGPGECLRIFTGAAVPARALAVLMQEDAKVDGKFISATRRLAPGENVRSRGGDLRKGRSLLAPGAYLGPVELALLAAVGQIRPRVASAPRVAHATTGDEIVPPDSQPGPGQIRNSNQALVSALLQVSRVPAANLHQEHWGDRAAHAARRLRSPPFAAADLILISGGASVGEHDYTARLLEDAGFNLAVRRVDVRPGRPLIVGFRGKQIAFGLPGNPVSHFVCFHLFVQRALFRLKGFAPPLWQRFPLSRELANCANRRPTYWPATLELDQRRRRAVVAPQPWNNSGHLAALLGVQLLFLVPPNTKKLPAGRKVETLFFPAKL